MANYGIKISEQGVDIKTANDNQLAFSSSFNTFKISAQGSTIITIPASNSSLHTRTIAHGFSYAPMFLVFVEPDNNKRYLVPVGQGSTQTVFGTDAKTDTTNLTITCSGDGSQGETIIDLYYYIFVDPQPS